MASLYILIPKVVREHSCAGESRYIQLYALNLREIKPGRSDAGLSTACGWISGVAWVIIFLSSCLLFSALFSRHPSISPPNILPFLLRGLSGSARPSLLSSSVRAGVCTCVMSGSGCRFVGVMDERA